MLQQHAVRVRACVYLLFDFLLVPACGSSDCRPPHCCTRTHNSKPLPQWYFALSRVYLWPRVTHMDPSPPSASGTYLSVTFFSAACLFDTCSYDMIYFHREEILRYISLALGFGNSQQNIHGHIAAIESHSSPKRKVYSTATHANICR